MQRWIVIVTITVILVIGVFMAIICRTDELKSIAALHKQIDAEAKEAGVEPYERKKGYEEKPFLRATFNAKPVAKPKQLVLKSWDVYTETTKFNEIRYDIWIKLTNKHDKDIKLIQAAVVFYDLLGARLFAIRVKPDGLIPAGAGVEVAGMYRPNHQFANELRMAQMAREDIRAKLIVCGIVFADNSAIHSTDGCMPEYTREIYR